MTISRNISVMAQGASSSGILAGGYGGLGASVSPTTAGNVLFTADGSVWSSTAKIVRGTSVSPTSGTSVDFTGIPSWVKKITVMFNGITFNTTNVGLIQLGSGSVTTSGYVCSVAGIRNGAGDASFTSGLALNTGVASTNFVGQAVFTNISANTWVGNNVCQYLSSGVIMSAASISLSGALDRVRFTTTVGTATFTAGSVNILYE